MFRMPNWPAHRPLEEIWLDVANDAFVKAPDDAGLLKLHQKHMARATPFATSSRMLRMIPFDGWRGYGGKDADAGKGKDADAGKGSFGGKDSFEGGDPFGGKTGCGGKDSFGGKGSFKDGDPFGGKTGASGRRRGNAEEDAIGAYNATTVNDKIFEEMPLPPPPPHLSFDEPPPGATWYFDEAGDAVFKKHARDLGAGYRPLSSEPPAEPEPARSWEDTFDGGDLGRLAGCWTDQKNSHYTVTRGRFLDTMDVLTRRPCGKVIRTAGLLKLIDGHVVWGSGQYPFVASFPTTDRVEWRLLEARGSSHAPFVWQREA